MCILVNNGGLIFCGQKTSFMLFLNKFDIFEKKILKVRTIHMSTLCHRWSVLSFQFNTLHCAGSAQCVWVVQRIPASFNREARDRTRVRVSKLFIPQGIKGAADGKFKCKMMKFSCKLNHWLTSMCAGLWRKSLRNCISRALLLTT